MAYVLVPLECYGIPSTLDCARTYNSRHQGYLQNRPTNDNMAGAEDAAE